MNTHNGIVEGLDEATYHSLPSLSSTGARLLLNSPAKFHYAQTHPQAHKDAFDLGTAVHSKVLGVGTVAVGYPEEHLTPSGAVSSKAATVEWLAEQRTAGLIVLTATQLAAVDGMAEALLAHPTGKALLEQDGIAEASVFATDPITGVDLRARFDLRAEVNVDVKTTSGDASPTEFAKSAARYGYHIQRGHYLDTDELATNERRELLFVVVETTAPYLVSVNQLDREFADMGQVEARRARELFAECTARDDWPGYDPAIQLTMPPVWAVYDYQDRYANV